LVSKEKTEAIGEPKAEEVGAVSLKGEEARIVAVPESTIPQVKPERRLGENAQTGGVGEKRRGKFELKEGTVSKLFNVVLGIVEKFVPELKDKLVLSELECELVDEMATPAIDDFLRSTGMEASSVEVLMVLVIIAAPRIIAVVQVATKKRATKGAAPTTEPTR